jgi:hypothetical protein
MARLRLRPARASIVPDNVTSRPSNGREAVSVCPILHGEFKRRAAAAG